MTTYVLRLLPGGAVNGEKLKDLVERVFARIQGTGDRRNELQEVTLQCGDPQEGERLLGVLGSPKALKAQYGEKAQESPAPVSLLVVLGDNTWTSDMERLVEHPSLAVEAVLRASHLGLKENSEADASEELLLEQALLRMVRQQERPKRSEEDFSKPVDWKAKLADEGAASLWSVFADPAMGNLLRDIKGALRDISGRGERLGQIKAAKKPWPKPKKEGASLFDVPPDVKWQGRLPSLLLLGESGTGKTLLANWIARAILGPEARAERKNMAAIPSDLVDTELFGARGGAFTDHSRDTLGFFLEHRGKVLFLDEIGDMAPVHQARLLAYLDNGMVHPVGHEGSFAAPAVVVAATNRPVEAWAQEGNDRFRGDLLARFDHVVRIPPLRERTADRRLLISLVLQDPEVNPKRADRRTVERISLEAIDFLERCPYPGNFRELRGRLLRGVRRAEREGCDVLALRHLLE